jgi:hypothetical protein
MGNVHSMAASAAAAAAASSGPNHSSSSAAGRLSSAGGSSNMSFNTFGGDNSYLSLSAGQGGVDNEFGGSGSGADRFSFTKAVVLHVQQQRIDYHQHLKTNKTIVSCLIISIAVNNVNKDETRRASHQRAEKHDTI